jgi:hypothetical protein
MVRGQPEWQAAWRVSNNPGKTTASHSTCYEILGKPLMPETMMNKMSAADDKPAN